MGVAMGVRALVLLLLAIGSWGDDPVPAMEHLPPLDDEFEHEDAPAPHEPPGEQLLENAHLKSMLSEGELAVHRVLGDIAELEGIAQPEEDVLQLLNHFDDIVKEVDLDGNGLLSVTEMTLRMKAVAKKRKKIAGLQAKAEVRAVIQLWDKDGDGALDKKEIKEYGKSKPTMWLNEQEREKLFFWSDSDKDGILLPEELLSMLHPEESGRQFEFWLNAAQEEIAMLDKNGDSLVSFEEYEQSFDNELTDLPDLPSLNTASFKQARKRKFDAHDTDKDGQLSEAEMRVMLHPTPQDEDAFLFHIDNEIQFFLEHADTNKDSLLSQEELLAIKDLLVGQFKMPSHDEL